MDEKNLLRLAKTHGTPIVVVDQVRGGVPDARRAFSWRTAARMACSTSSAQRSSASCEDDRRSISNHASSGIEFTLIPPPILHTDSVVRGNRGKGIAASFAAVAPAACTGFATPNAAQLWPPVPRKVTR